MQPETRFTNVGQDRIAYQVFGEGPPDLIYFSGTPSNVDLRWEEPLQEHWFRRLALFSRVILFDERGFGISDPISEPGESIWEQRADDVRAVMDATGSERAAVFATLDGGPSALLFAATYPERTAALILANTTARWVVAEDYPEGLAPDTADAFVTMMLEVWGREEAAHLIFPSVAGDEIFRHQFAKFLRGAAHRRDVAAAFEATLKVDVRHVLPLIRVPTLVVHHTGFSLVPTAQGRYLARNIPQANFVELPGADAGPWAGDHDEVLAVIQEFLTGAKPQIEIDRVLATVLFTDIVCSTERAAKLGDRRWRELLDTHDTIVRHEVERFRGRVIKSTGDGALAIFDGPARAVHCAVTMGERLREIGLETRSGLHTGEIELREGDDVGGIAVHIGARVSALAHPGEVLVSRTVVDLVTGSGIAFVDRGERELRGVPGTWSLFSVKA